MSIADQLPDNVRSIIGLERLNKVPANRAEDGAASGENVKTNGADCSSRRNSIESDNVTLGDNEVSFEKGLNLSYM